MYSVDSDFDSMGFNFSPDSDDVPWYVIGERTLWCQVIAQWWYDLNGTDELEVQSCKAWHRTQDCRLVCELAGINIRVIKQVTRLVELGYANR